MANHCVFVTVCVKENVAPGMPRQRLPVGALARALTSLAKVGRGVRLHHFGTLGVVFELADISSTKSKP